MKALVISPQRFNANELRPLMRVLRDRGIEFVVGVTGVTHDEDGRCLLWNELNKDEAFELRPPHGWLAQMDIKAEDFDGIIISSGDPSQTTANWHNSKLLDLVRDFHDQGKPVAAICVSVPVIREAARGRYVSYFPLEASRKLLNQSIRSSKHFIRDGDIVTAEHQMATVDWVSSFADALEEHQLEVAK